MKWITEDGGWSPYLAGALVGILAIFSVYATTQWMGKANYLGASTTFVRAAGLLERTAFPERVAANEYFTKEKVRVDWQFMLVLGIFFWCFDRLHNRQKLQAGKCPANMEKTVRSFDRKTWYGRFFRRNCCHDGCPHGRWLPQRTRAQRHDAVVGQCFFCLSPFFRSGCGRCRAYL